MKIRLVGWLACVLCLSVQAEVYRWVDSNGKVHFGDRPPKGQASEMLDLPESKSDSETPALSDQQRMARQKKLVEILEEERMEKENAKREAKEQAEKLAMECTRMKKRLEYMERYNRFYHENEDGTRQYMNDQQADAYRQRRYDQYRQKCQ